MITSCNKKEQDVTIFIGDSLIKNWDLERYFPYLNTENHGVDGYTIEQCQEHTIQYEHASSIVLLVGTNDLNHETLKIEPIIEEYIELINKYNNVKKIYCISILPKNNFPNNIIEDFNERLEKELVSIENTVFINVYNDFLWNGVINPEYTIDGLHLSTKGYELLTYKLSKCL